MQKNKFFIVFLFVLNLVLALSFVFSSLLLPKYKVYAEELTSAKSMVVIEASTKRVLAEKNMNDQRAMASTTKIMTALLTVENVKNLDEIVSINDNAVGIEGTSMYLRKGEQLTVRELLYGLMLPSGNDAAMALAYYVGGSEEKFVEMMNDKAKSLNLKNTHFANPHGLDAEGHYTSAYDLAVITAEGLKNEAFKEIVSTKNVKVKGSKDGEPRFLSNKNKLLRTFDGCNGVKTGFTDNAGRCFVGSAERDGMTLICVVLSCGPMFEDTANLLDQCFNKYKMREILKEFEVGERIDVISGEKNNVETLTKNAFSYPLSDEEYLNLKIVRNCPESLQAPIKKEQEVGNLQIYLNNNLLFSEKIYTISEVKSTKYLDKIWEVVDNWNI